MGLNAYFAYTVVLGMGYSWEYALTAVFAEGIIFILLSATNVREAIFNAIPQNLKAAVSVGIGLFIAFIGLQNAKIVIGGSTLLQLFSVDKYNEVNGVSASFNDVGITVLLAIIGIIVTGILVVKNIKGNILWGILITWLLGIICQFTGLYVPNADLGFYSLLPNFSNGLSIPSLSPIFCKLDFSGIFSLNFIVILFAFLFVDLFDTIGTLIGVSAKADMLDENGKLPRIKGALMADAVATTVGAVIGTSTTTTFVESASGVSEGGRTDLHQSQQQSFSDCHCSCHHLPCNTIICHSTGTSNCRTLHAHERNKHRFQRYVRSNPLLCMHHRNAILLQHLRRNLNGSYHIRGTQPDHRKSKRKESQHTHVRTGSTVHIEICIL